MQWTLLLALVKSLLTYLQTQFTPGSGAYLAIGIVLQILAGVVLPAPSGPTTEAVPQAHLGKVAVTLPAQPWTTESMKQWADGLEKAANPK